jgi:intein/homing endonuclease
MVMGYDHETESISWQPLQAVNVFGYKGKLLESTHRGKKVLRCTPNHRLPVYCKQGRKGPVGRKWIEAKDITAGHRVPCAARFVDADEPVLGERLSSILAWAVTDGSGLLDRYKNDCVSI